LANRPAGKKRRLRMRVEEEGLGMGEWRRNWKKQTAQRMPNGRRMASRGLCRKRSLSGFSSGVEAEREKRDGFHRMEEWRGMLEAEWKLRDHEGHRYDSVVPRVHP
jgi:hypothetical protein